MAKTERVLVSMGFAFGFPGIFPPLDRRQHRTDPRGEQLCLLSHQLQRTHQIKPDHTENAATRQIGRNKRRGVRRRTSSVGAIRKDSGGG